MAQPPKRTRLPERTVVDASAIPKEPSEYVPPEDEPADEAGPATDDDLEAAPPRGEATDPHAAAVEQPPDGGTVVFNVGTKRPLAIAGPKGCFSGVGGPRKGAEHTHAADETTIGRANDNVWVIPDISVSRRHILVRRTSRGFTIADQGFGNGTLVNGEALEGE